LEFMEFMRSRVNVDVNVESECTSDRIRMHV